jgi:hypothetical protein
MTQRDIHQRLENIRMILHTFKVEQESLILKFNDEYKFRLNRPSNFPSVNATNPTAHTTAQYAPFHNKNLSSYLQPPGSSTGEQPLHTVDPSDTSVIVSKLLNIDSVIMPMGNDLFSNQRLWPQALNAFYRDSLGRIANIESHGSLWKLVPRKDNMPGQRVLLQSAVSYIWSCFLIVYIFFFILLLALLTLCLFRFYLSLSFRKLVKIRNI